MNNIHQAASASSSKMCVWYGGTNGG